MAFAILPATLTAEDPQSIKHGTAGEALTIGHCIRKNSVGKFVIADSEVGVEDNMDGVALNTAINNGPVAYAPPGTFLTVSGLVAGETYYLGGAADEGKVGVRADAVLGTHFATIAGVTYSATRFRVLGWNTDVQL